MSEARLLTAAQVAALARVTTRTVARWAESGLLPAAMKLPGPTGAYLFSEDDVRSLLEATEVHS